MEEIALIVTYLLSFEASHKCVCLVYKIISVPNPFSLCIQRKAKQTVKELCTMFKLMTEFLEIWHLAVRSTVPLHLNIKISRMSTICQLSRAIPAFPDDMERFVGLLKLVIGVLKRPATRLVLLVLAIQKTLNSVLVLSLEISSASGLAIFTLLV